MTTPVAPAASSRFATAASGSRVASQLALIDLLKGGAAQLIVLHHLAFYGPMADHVRSVAPSLLGWLYSDARIAVQVFLVISGFLAAKSLSTHGTPGISDPLTRIMRRYAKLVPPFLVATLLAVTASAWAGLWMTHDSISPSPDLPQLAAHALLLHSILGFESISAGAWYVAIDFQLYAAFIFLLWISGRLASSPGSSRPLSWLMPALVVCCIGASLLHFNRDSGWDAWAPYFFGSYGLGILAWWAGDPARRPATAMLLLAAIVLPTLAALAIDFRSRIAVAMVTACVLALMGRARPPLSAAGLAAVSWLGRVSYSVFLVHFSVCLIVNAAFTRFFPLEPLPQALGMLFAWAASLAAGAAFHRWVETPLNRLCATPGLRLRSPFLHGSRQS